MNRLINYLYFTLVKQARTTLLQITTMQLLAGACASETGSSGDGALTGMPRPA
jgi:hypothetical protein